MFVYKIQVNAIHSILKYGYYYYFMDRLFWKLNNSVHEYFFFKILLIAIDWNF